MAIVTFDTEILEKMRQPDFMGYLKGLHNPDPATGVVETEEQRIAREAELEWFTTNFDGAYPMAEKFANGLQCLFNCAKEYIDCRRIYQNYPEAFECDENAVTCFANCYYTW